MIELITGTPGAGKTTYGVSERLLPESRRELVLDDVETCATLGVDVGHRYTRRVVVAGVRGLKVEHERLGHQLTRDAPSAVEVAKWNAYLSEKDPETGKLIETDRPVHERLPGEAPLDVECCVQNWWLWVRPGDLVFVDEAQWLMPRATMGKKPPVWIVKLEVHRHYGVDFVFVTQDPGLIDTTVRKLVGMHRHVRPVMGSPVCMVYTWDHASNPERYNLANKATFVRRARHYRLFHSAAAHVKPPTSGRWALVAVPVLMAVAGIGLASKFSGWMKPANAASKAPQSSQEASTRLVGTTAAAGKPPEPLPGRPRGWAHVPELGGCYSVGKRCTCIDTAGRHVSVADAMCRVSSSTFDGLVQWAPSTGVRYEGADHGKGHPVPPPSSSKAIPGLVGGNG